MDDAKEKSLNIALNKISGDWDKDKLALLIADLQGEALMFPSPVLTLPRSTTFSRTA